MIHNRLITENQLDEYVRGNARIAQGLIVELIFRLVAVSTPNPIERRFPLADSIGQHGPDGILNTAIGFNPFVPEGSSFWEIGTGLDAGAKATADYSDLVKALPEDIRHNATFVFVTPLSGRRDWPHTWKEEAQGAWLSDRRSRGEWKDVRVLDGTKLIDWMLHFPSVERWLATQMGIPASEIATPEERWHLLRQIGAPPPLAPEVFLANREAAGLKLKDLLSGTTLQLRIDTHFPEQVVDFVVAYLAAMTADTRADVAGRCLIINGPEAWKAMAALPQPHILVIDSYLDDSDRLSLQLLQQSLNQRHAVVYGGLPGGIPHANRIQLPNAKSYQLQEALEKSGYPKERARLLAIKSDGNFSALLRCLHNLSLMPEWSQGTNAAELAIAELLGNWNENVTGDKVVAEGLLGKAYGEWIGAIREIALRPGTPLTQRDGIWKFVSRYQGWYALGPSLFDDHLDRLKINIVEVLKERDPKFELSPDERFAASIHGKILRHSHQLRRGLAETLALLGSHPKALTSCSFGKPDSIAVLAVREILEEADWVLWASLNDLLPLFAEAAPVEFLDAVEKALNASPTPFIEVFSQEGSGITGSNYMTGLLWALETLAWDAEYLTRVVIILAELASKDPGGNWANRPSSALAKILLPWFPQTSAPISKRHSAVATLLQELPAIGWKLLLDLLPESQQISTGSRKPAWREMIPQDWAEGVTRREYWEQIAIYADLAVSAAKEDLDKLVQLIDRIDDLPPPARDKLLAHLGSQPVLEMSEAARLRLWDELVGLVTKHRKYADAKWAMKGDVIDQIAVLADQLAPRSPIYLHQRLFGEREFELMEKKTDFAEQRKILEELRRKAIAEVLDTGGFDAILKFTRSVESPQRVGFSLGSVGSSELDSAILPALLESEEKALAQLAGAYIWGRFRSKQWDWVDSLDIATWQELDKGQFLAYLPFTSETWSRVNRLLPSDESPYWTKASANPYEADAHLEIAVDHLLQHGRANVAIMCLERMQLDNMGFTPEQAIRALDALYTTVAPNAMDVYTIVDVIKALQNNPNTDPNSLFEVEWRFLPFLNEYHDASPKLLERRLADDPAFFCDVIRVIYRSKDDDTKSDEPSEQQKNIAENAYRLLTHWRTPPGSRPDGTFDGEVLAKWLEGVKAACQESGHLEVALIHVGHVFVYAPKDSDGLWIVHSVAKALNAKDAENIRDGFSTELYNSRGVHSWSAGREEKGLAEKYKADADAVEKHGYHRFAQSLRKLAGSYERDAERQATRDSLED